MFLFFFVILTPLFTKENSVSTKSCNICVEIRNTENIDSQANIPNVLGFNDSKDLKKVEFLQNIYCTTAGKNQGLRQPNYCNFPLQFQLSLFISTIPKHTTKNRSFIDYFPYVKR